MISKRITGSTRTIGKSQGYIGPAVRDEILDGVPMMTTSWEPTPAELERLNAGKPVLVKILGLAHPPIKVDVAKD